MKLKIGDKVRVYDCGKVHDATVLRLTNTTVECCNSQAIYTWYSIKQVRKLKPKRKKRTFAIYICRDSYFLAIDTDQVEEKEDNGGKYYRSHNCLGWVKYEEKILVKEVLK